jgi:hypothetical protein
LKFSVKISAACVGEVASKTVAAQRAALRRDFPEVDLPFMGYPVLRDACRMTFFMVIGLLSLGAEDMNDALSYSLANPCIVPSAG